MSAERWLPVPGWPRYEVSDLGRVRNTDGRILAQHPNDKGYLRVSLCQDGRQVHARVHTLVLIAFVGPRPTSLHEGRHLDDVQTHNAAGNLAWGTEEENRADAIRNGKARLGVRAAVVHLRAEGLTRRQIAARLGITPDHVKKLGRPLPPCPCPSRLGTIPDVCLADELGVSTELVGRWRRDAGVSRFGADTFVARRLGALLPIEVPTPAAREAA